MAEENKNIKKSSKKSSKVQVTTLSNEELLEQILNKKKTKTKTTNVTKKNTTVRTVKKDLNKEIKPEISSDELLDKILEKKKQKKTTRKVKSFEDISNIDESKITMESSENPEGNTDSDLVIGNLNEQQIAEKAKEETIISHEIDFDLKNFNIKDKKHINKLKNALDDFEKQEMVKEMHLIMETLNANKKESKPRKGELPEGFELPKLKDPNKKKSKFKTGVFKKQIFTKQKDVLEDEFFLDVNNHDHVKDKELIITREIKVDDQFDLNNKKTLKELREAIEAFDKIEDLEEINAHTKSDIDEVEDKNKEYVVVIDKTKKKETLPKVRKPKVKKVLDTEHVQYDNNERQRFYLIWICILLICIFCMFLGIYFSSDLYKGKKVYDSEVSNEKDKNDDKDSNLFIMKEVLLLNKYNICLNRPYDENDMTNYLENEIQELNDFLKKNYNASVKYEDLSLGFTYEYKKDIVYYAASTIKTLDALYIYNMAADGKIDLDDTMTYSSKYKISASAEMKKYKYGEKVSIRNLVKYAVEVSDNSAHQMLVDYIGRSNLKEYGKSLGAKNTLIGGDNFGSISVEDGIIYAKELDRFISENEELGKELESYFLAAEQNDLSIPEYDIKAAHKYGQYEKYYHDIGIVYDDRKYVIAILTLEGNGNFEQKVKDINKHIYELHKEFYKNRENVCRVEVYGK